jgi:hypothetical protein
MVLGENDEPSLRWVLSQAVLDKKRSTPRHLE